MKNLKKAVALKYEAASDAPTITASGVGKIAEKILSTADENSVPIVYNKELVNMLSNVDIGESIPEELYEAVAEILAYVMDVDREQEGG